MNVCICEPEQGTFLGENKDDDKKRPVESLTNCLEYQHKGLMAEPFVEAKEPIVFKYDNWGVNVGFLGIDEAGQSLSTVN